MDPNQNKNKPQSQQPHQNQSSQPKAQITMATETPPIQLQQAPPAIELKEKAEPERMFNVRIRKEVKSMRYGQETYTFAKGKDYPVNASLRTHLEEKGII